MDATPVYFDMPGAPGQYFVCGPYKSSLSVSSCVGMFRAEKGRQNGRHPHCNGCRLGAIHAGEKPAVESDFFESKICPRCTQLASRIVRGVCVSCINRQYEVERNCNAKGSAPSRLRALRPLTVTFAAEGEVQAAAFPRVTGMVEAVLRVLRTQPGEVEFGWSAQALPQLPQGDLFSPRGRPAARE